MTDNQSDDNLERKNYARQLAREYAELDTPRVKAQMALDRAWQSKLDDEFEENEWIEIGGVSRKKIGHAELPPRQAR